MDKENQMSSIGDDVEARIRNAGQTHQSSFTVEHKITGRLSIGKSVKDTLFQMFLQERGLQVEDYLELNPCTRDVLISHFRTWVFDRESERVHECTKKKDANI